MPLLAQMISQAQGQQFKRTWAHLQRIVFLAGIDDLQDPTRWEHLGKLGPWISCLSHPS